MKLHYFLFWILICSSPTLHAYTTYAFAGGVVGGKSYPQITTNILTSDLHTDSHIDLASHANGSVFDQAFDPATESGYDYKRQ